MSKRTNKGTSHPKEFFALGSKTAKSDVDKSNSLITLSKKSSLSNLVSFKNDSGSALLKKSHLIGNVKVGGGGISRQLDIEHRSSPTTQMYLYEDVAIDVDGHELLDSIIEASTSDFERVEGLICGAIRHIKLNRNKLDRSIYLSLIFLAKTQSQLYQSDIIIEALCSLLKRDNSANIKMKGNSTVAILACNIFLAAFQYVDSWPESLIKAYMEDCLGDRTWVDRQDCRCFVENIMTAFSTKLGNINVFNIELLSKPDVPASTNMPDSSPNDVNQVEEGSTTSAPSSIDASLSTSTMLYHKSASDSDLEGMVLPRYSSQQQQTSIEAYVLEVIRDQLSRRMPLDGGSRNLVRTMTVVCTYAEVRTLAAHRLEMWLTSPKLTRSAQDLLMAVCINCNPQQHQQDVDLLNLLSRIRLKTKNLTNHYIACIRELLGTNNDNLPVLLAQMITNELSAIRNPNNMTFISVIFHQAPDISAKLLAEAFLDCLSNREDYLRQLRLLLREVVRCVKHDFNFSSFVFSLLQDRCIKMRDFEPTIKEKFIYGVIDVICLSVLLCCNPSVREAAASLNKSEIKNVGEIELVRNYQKQVMFMMRDAVWWLESIVIKLCPPKSIDYLHCLRKVLFLEGHEHYCKVDGWPTDTERGLILKLASEMSLMGDTLQRVLKMATNRELQLKPADMLDLIETIVKKAASIHTDDGNFPVLKVHHLEIIDLLLSLTTYKHPENTVLPKLYQPPALAITSLYWKALTILIIIASFNPTTIGLKIWTNYPTLKCLMEMIMTNNFTFPPPTMATDEIMAENIRAKERQMAEFCKQQTLEFECHLASSTITELNSRLVHLVARFEPLGFVLRPNLEVIDKLKQLNQSLHLGLLLCQSREPADFLLSIIQQQGSSESMPWLIDLIECNESSLDILPVQCLCEFLLHGVVTNEQSTNTTAQKTEKHNQLVSRLQNLLSSTSSSPTDDPKNLELIGQALTFFFKKLNAPKSSARRQATLALSALLVDIVDEKKDTDKINLILPSYNWLLQSICHLKHFEHFKRQLCFDIRSTWQIETDSLAISAYTIFIHQHTKDFELNLLDEIALDLATMVVERSIMLNHILPWEGTADSTIANLVQSSIIGIFNNYIGKIQQNLKDETIEWENTQDQIRVQWANGRSAQMNIIVVHAMTIILSYGQPIGESEFNELLDIWFPNSGPAPTAYLVDTMEEALIFPDWLKLKMIRSPVNRLVDAALVDLEPQQLLLFVQSFGIPVSSMTRLLTLLDSCMLQDAQAVEKQIVDKTYMSQLVDVQRRRGATGGETFYNMLIVGTKKEKSTDCDSALIPLLCVHG